ncbi:uncharacterized protein METZ01_LOCUS113853 [marine metagenome]|uniref:Uncharacterized protein n=1 Tax=marine metagenome TaxID=408172 RepID=A0A381X8B6_9ZZZZ
MSESIAAISEGSTSFTSARAIDIQSVTWAAYSKRSRRLVPSHSIRQTTVFSMLSSIHPMRARARGCMPSDVNAMSARDDAPSADHATISLWFISGTSAG